jgi:prolyl 4-hydroxylase
MIHEFTGVLEQEECDALINLFETNKKFHERFDKDNRPSFTQLNITNNNLGSELQDAVIDKVFKMIEHYRHLNPTLPAPSGLEELRIKKYNPDGDQFNWHVDVTNHSTAIRSVALQIYLNTVEKGGETVFKVQGKQKVIKPIAGNAFCFPPMWMFPHCGKPTESQPKYILTTYMHYLKD